MPDLTLEQLESLKSIAEKASSGPWKWGPADPDRLDGEPTGTDDALWAGSHRVLTDGSARAEYSPDIDVFGPDANHIAAFDPSTCIQLVEMALECVRLREAEPCWTKEQIEQLE